MKKQIREPIKKWLDWCHKQEMDPWIYDFKRILLGSNYDETNPIRNILLAKNTKNYQDREIDYWASRQWFNQRGHLENYKIIDGILSIISSSDGNSFYDVMNSFWTTYKCHLQMMYPAIFAPTKITGDAPLHKQKAFRYPHRSYPPYVSKDYELISDKYIQYYNENLSDLELIVNQGDTWVDFLLNNFNKFGDVHHHRSMQRFAQLTHTIGNICVVPKGFNRGRGYNDYWDIALIELKKFLLPLDAWEKYIEIYMLENYVEENNRMDPKRLWSRHMISSNPSYLLPTQKVDVNELLNFVNPSIETRGKRMIEKLKNDMLYEGNI